MVYFVFDIIGKELYERKIMKTRRNMLVVFSILLLVLACSSCTSIRGRARFYSTDNQQIFNENVRSICFGNVEYRISSKKTPEGSNSSKKRAELKVILEEMLNEAGFDMVDNERSDSAVLNIIVIYCSAGTTSQMQMSDVLVGEVADKHNKTTHKIYKRKPVEVKKHTNPKYVVSIGITYKNKSLFGGHLEIDSHNKYPEELRQIVMHVIRQLPKSE